MAKKRSGKGRKHAKKAKVRYVEVAPQPAQGMLAGLSGLLPESTSERFLLGAVIGGAAAYVLSDEAARARIMRFAIKGYGDLVGGLAELREQAADIQAEILAERHQPS